MPENKQNKFSGEKQFYYVDMQVLTQITDDRALDLC